MTRPGMFAVVATLVFSALVPASGCLWAQGFFLDLEFTVNENTALCGGRPHVVSREDGSFSVVWFDFTAQAIKARAFDAGGVGAMEVPLHTDSGLVLDDAAGSVNGGFVVSWTDFLAPGGGSQVWASRFDSDGTELGTEFAVSTDTDPNVQSALAMGDNGDFLVIWVDSFSVVGRRYSADGSPAGAQFTVNSSGSSPNTPDVAMDPDSGEFVVSWQDVVNGNDTDILARRFDSGGSALGGQFGVNSYTTGEQWDSAVSMAADGSFYVTWDGPRDGGIRDVSIAHYDASGVKLLEADLGDPVDEQQLAAIASSRDGGSIIVPYEREFGNVNLEGPAPTHSDIYAFMMEVANNGISMLNSGDQESPDVALDESDRAIVVWQSDSDEDACGEIAGQRIQLWRVLDGSETGTVHSRVQQSGWKYFIYFPSVLGAVEVSLTGLLQDADLYVLSGNFPTLTTFDCRPFQGPGTPESCIAQGDVGLPIFVGVNAYDTGNLDFTLSAAPVPPLFVDGFESGDTSAWSVTVP